MVLWAAVKPRRLSRDAGPALAHPAAVEADGSSGRMRGGPRPLHPLKVVYCVAYFENFTGGQRSLTHLVTNLPPRVEAVVLVPGEGGVAQGMRAHGVRVRVVPAPERLNVFEQALVRASLRQKAMIVVDYLRFTLRVRQAVRSERADVVHCNETRSVLFFGLGARLAGRPVVWHIRGGTLLTGRWALRALAQRVATRVVSVCDALHDEVDRRVPVQTIYNGVPRFRPPSGPSASAELGRFLRGRGVDRSRAFCLLTASSLVPYKGLHHVVEAMGILRRSDVRLERDVYWVVLGDANSPEKQRYRSVLEHLAEREGVAQNILWAGWQEHAAVWMHQCDAVLLPSVAEEEMRLPDGARLRVVGTEGFPRIVLEAMSVGRPVIASRVAGVEEASRHLREAILVPPGDAEAIATAIRLLIDDPGLYRRLSTGGLERSESFSIETMVDATVQLYDGLVRAGSGVAGNRP